MKRGNVDAIYRPDSMTFQDKHIRPHLLIPNIGFNNIMIASSRKVDGCSNLPGLGAELHLRFRCSENIWVLSVFNLHSLGPEFLNQNVLEMLPCRHRGVRSF